MHAFSIASGSSSPLVGSSAFRPAQSHAQGIDPSVAGDSDGVVRSSDYVGNLRDFAVRVGAEITTGFASAWAGGSIAQGAGMLLGGLAGTMLGPGIGTVAGEAVGGMMGELVGVVGGAAFGVDLGAMVARDIVA